MGIMDSSNLSKMGLSKMGLSKMGLSKMGLSKTGRSHQVVFDPVREAWVRATPEELVRQKWIRRLLGPLGFPKGLLVVEKPLRELPHLAGVSVPDRRLDLLCYATGVHSFYPLYPLLLIECKASPLTESALDQLIGYNHHVKTPFIAAVTSEEVQFGYKEGETYQFYSFLPAFKELLQWVKR